MKSTWRFVLKIVGLSLAVAGLICVIIGFWDKLAEDVAAVAGNLCSRHGKYPEFNDYDDDLFYED
ncbi:MAG: hypothetical protein HFF62_00595 [Oscillospiraceae bacterium]|nr:hypothetical protein [Oscillospiraceae bacterium]